MAQIALPRYPRAVVSVGTILTVVVPPLDISKHDKVVLEIENLGTDTFTGVIWTSMDGDATWVPFQDDSFSAMAPSTGIPHIARIPSDMLWIRVTGTFAVTPGTVRRAAYLISSTSRSTR